MKKKLGLIGFVLVFPLVLLPGCGDFILEDDVTAEITGKWYNMDYELVFEITQEGEGYIAAKKLHCTVTLSGHYVYFRYDGNLRGSFYYSINSSGELTMTNAMGDFSGIASSSQFVRSGTIPQTGKIPVEFIGKWFAVTTAATPSFEIETSGTIRISGDSNVYTAIVSGNTISVLSGSLLKGQFQYLIRYGEMTVTNGTDICLGLAILSPFIKKNN